MINGKSRTSEVGPSIVMGAKEGIVWVLTGVVSGAPPLLA